MTAVTFLVTLAAACEGKGPCLASMGRSSSCCGTGWFVCRHGRRGGLARSADGLSAHQRICSVRGRRADRAQGRMPVAAADRERTRYESRPRGVFTQSTYRSGLAAIEAAANGNQPSAREGQENPGDCRISDRLPAWI
jgi:hypothetical protein